MFISQRVDLLPERNERRDSIDQRWGGTLHELLGGHALILQVPNRPLEVSEMLTVCPPSLIVLSGGNDIGSVPDRDATETTLLDFAKSTRVPVLAVCRGMQIVQRYLGGAIVPINDHVGCEHEVHPVSGHAAFDLTVNSYHTSGIPQSGLASDLQPLYLHEDGSIEAAMHSHLPWLCVMWHPEREGSGMSRANSWLSEWLKAAV